MELYKGFLFNGRYSLINRLGEGASAEVWHALDTKAGNLDVALKIRLNVDELDTIGLHNFEKEFVSAFNMKHTNLLTPTSYDISDGQPFLVMPYCENGSCEIMCGRIEEKDLLILLRDVSAGLEYLHAAGMIHQDIKPANILIDDNMSYLVSDFGISTFTGHGNEVGSGSGTPAYAAPERFNGKSLPASDMWALGASAIELLTGELPFGEHGGLLQASEPLPELPNISSELRTLIYSCMTPEPERRITAGELHSRIAHFLESGSWISKPRNHVFAYIAASVCALFLCGGMFFWDANRTKVQYYHDYVEIFGVPKGVGRISPSVQQHREQTYRFEFRRFKLRRVALVNYKGKVISHGDTEHVSSRFSDVRYFYTDNGNLDYKAIYNTSGGMLYKMDYDENLRTATFRQNDEFGTEYNLMAATSDLHHQENIFDNKSPISRYFLNFDEQGHLKECRYAGLQNVIVHDADNIFGIRYNYDQKGHVVELQYIDAEGNATANHIGLSKKIYTYNEDDLWTGVKYLGINGEPSHDGQNCYSVAIEYDEFGNRSIERYFGPEGERVYRTDNSVSGYRQERNEYGLASRVTLIDANDMPIQGESGYAMAEFQYDENGFVSEISFFDEDHNPILSKVDDMSVARVVATNDEVGNQTSRKYFDDENLPIEEEGYSMIKSTFDTFGNPTSLAYYNAAEQPAKNLDNIHLSRQTYNDLNQMTELRCFDVNEQPALNSKGWSIMKIERNRQGAPLRTEYLNEKGLPVMTAWGYATRLDEYDELGNLVVEKYLDERGEPCMYEDDFASVRLEYDKLTNYVTSRNYFDKKDRLIKTQKIEYDNRGNITRQWEVGPSGSLLKGTVVETTEYNQLNLPIRSYSATLSGTPILFPKHTYAEVRRSYDNRGNNIVTSYWDANGNPAIDAMHTHRREQKYDNMNRVVYEINYGKDGKPISGVNSNPEGWMEYDRWGHPVEITCYDGYGKPRLSADGVFRMVYSYNKHNQLQEIACYDTNGSLTKSKSNGYARYTKEYNDEHLLVAENYFDSKNKLFRVERYRYNTRRKTIEMSIYNGSNKLDDSYGFSKLKTEYYADSVTPNIRRYYTSSGTMVATQKYNVKEHSWYDLQVNEKAFVQNNWRQAVGAFAATCPLEMDGGITLQSITLLTGEVLLTIKVSIFSRNDITDDVMSELRNSVRTELAPSFRELLGIPKGILVSIKLLDKDGYIINTFN